MSVVNEICLIADAKALVASEAFFDVSHDEMRTFVAILASNGKMTSYEKLSHEAGISIARAKSATALFLELGAVREADEFAVVEDEFAKKEDTVKSVEVAKSVRDECLKELFDECTVLLGRTDGLSSEEVKALSGLVTDKALGSEYVAALTAYLAEKWTAKDKKLTVNTIVREAERLLGKNIDTLETLEVYIINKENETRDEWEFRRVIGLFGRSPSDGERDAFRRWAEEYKYSVPIIKAAYNIAVLNISVNSNPVSYMDKVITAWHDAGYRTVEECLADHERGKHKNKAEAADKAPRGKRSAEAEKPRFSDFDSEDALKRALERSYGAKEDN